LICEETSERELTATIVSVLDENYRPVLICEETSERELTATIVSVLDENYRPVESSLP
jgi:hypothetical protein